MNKITTEHLNKTAIIYIRQSTKEQLKNNHESRIQQYKLKDKAKEKGFRKIQIIDDDLGKSASGYDDRKGFDKVIKELCQGKIGAIFALEASRLARNGREWHTLLEICGFMNTLLIDFDGIYDPKNPNDRLVLGMKGTISEMELSIFRQRSVEALRQKAERGELFFSVAVGYIRVTKDTIQMDPNKRIKKAIYLIFKEFRKCLSVRQVLIWFRQEKIKLPSVEYIEGERVIKWRLPVYNKIRRILSNPVYAGAYAFGQTYTKIKIINTKKIKIGGNLKKIKDWTVLIKDHHKGYIDWDEYEKNQKLIANNANMKGLMVKRSVRKGNALLAGLLRCGHCGRKLRVSYDRKGKDTARYVCVGANIAYGTDKCISFGGLKVHIAVEQELLEILSPLSLQAALHALDELDKYRSDKIEQKELELQQAVYEAEKVQKQYNLVDPANRLVAAELENTWNHELLNVDKIKEELELIARCNKQLSEKDRKQIIALGDDIKNIWYNECCSITIKKQIIRMIIEEIIVTIKNDVIRIIIHWNGGSHSELLVKKNRTGCHRYTIDFETKELIINLAKTCSDRQITMVLNKSGKKTGKGNQWTQARVRSFRNKHNIPVFKKEEMQKNGKIFLKEAAEILNISKRKMYQLIVNNIVKAEQACPGAPWIINKEDIANKTIISYCENKKSRIKNLVENEQLDLFANI